MRELLKQYLPGFMTKSIRHAQSYARRILTAFEVYGAIEGVSHEDRRIVRRSMLYTPFLMLKNLDQWRDPYLLEGAEIVSKGLGRFKLRARSDDLIHVMASHHSGLFGVIRNILKEGDTVIDAGANIGGVTVFMANQVGLAGKVVAVEMMPDTARVLEHNLRLNDLAQVTIVERALSNQSGGYIQAQVPEGFFGQASIAESIPAAQLKIRHVEVPLTTIDAMAAGLNEIALMKMDLEGAEPQALAGAIETLPRIKNILFESWGGDGDPTEEILQQNGFEISPVDGRNFLASRPSSN